MCGSSIAKESLASPGRNGLTVRRRWATLVGPEGFVMCLDCNCGQPGAPPGPGHTPSAGHNTSAEHNTGTGQRRVALEARLLGRNDTAAAANRSTFRSAGVRVVNLLSSPGSGKTALLERLGRDRAPDRSMAVVVGDLATDNDAVRLRAADIEAVQITTGQACHLESEMVSRAIAGLHLDGLDLLVIENVGNLVCPAAYDLGEDLRVVMLSVSEGEDKPLKYPATFHTADLVVISKLDLAGACGFDRRLALANIARVAPRARVMAVSARSGEGMENLAAALGIGGAVAVG